MVPRSSMHPKNIHSESVTAHECSSQRQWWQGQHPCPQLRRPPWCSGSGSTSGVSTGPYLGVGVVIGASNQDAEYRVRSPVSAKILCGTKYPLIQSLFFFFFAKRMVSELIRDGTIPGHDKF